MNKLLIFGAMGIIVVLIGLIFAVSEIDTIVNDTIEIYELNKLRNGAIWELTGKTTDIDQEISFFVYNPDGDLIFEHKELADSNGEFKTVITTGGPLWRHAGLFTITVQQGDELYPDNSRVFEITEEEVQRKLDFINGTTP